MIAGVGQHGGQQHNEGYGGAHAHGVLEVLETPRKEHIPRNRDKMMLETKMELKRMPKVLCIVSTSFFEVVDCGEYKAHGQEGSGRSRMKISTG